MSLTQEKLKEHNKKCLSLINGLCDCDGYHTFDELYEHRNRLFIELCKRLYQLDFAMRRSPQIQKKIWCSTLHSDGSSFGDWFILGIGKETNEQISYHLPAKFWNEVCEFAEVLEKAHTYDGHTSDDVLKRLEKL